MQKKLKKILLVAYHYPPEGSSSGVLRTLKFSKYLPEFGWRPHVLTVKEDFYRQRDEQLAREVPPEVTVHRTFALDTQRYLGIPDRFVGWVPFGISAAKKIIREERIDAIFSTSPLPSAHLIAYRLKKRFGIPWVTDFRDPWIEEGLWPKPGTLRFRIESFLENKVVSAADRVSVTTGGLKQELTQRYPQLSEDKFVVIENGFDEADFIKIQEETNPDSNGFLILHAGMVNSEFRDPFPVLEALAELTQRGELKRKLRVCFLGGGSYVESEAFAARVRQLAAPEIVEVKKRVSYFDGLRLLLRSHALLLLQDSEDTRNLTPAKAFESLRAKKPILALMQEGATADLIRSTDSGFLLDRKNPESMRKTMQKLLTRADENVSHSSRLNGIERYERRHLTERLAGTLEDMVGAAA